MGKISQLLARHSTSAVSVRMHCREHMSHDLHVCYSCNSFWVRVFKILSMEPHSVAKFRDYLRIKSVHPTPDYGKLFHCLLMQSVTALQGHVGLCAEL